MNHENVTVPVGVGKPTCPVTVAWSCTVVPAGTDVTVAWAASWITVTVVDATGVTVNGSHGPGRAGVRAVTRVRRLERETPRHDRRLRERRPVHDTAASA